MIKLTSFIYPRAINKLSPLSHNKVKEPETTFVRRMLKILDIFSGG